MAEAIKRDRQAQLLSRTYGMIKRDAEKATLPMIKVWQKQLDDQKVAFDRYQDIVIDRAGTSELDDQHKVHDIAETCVFEANMMLEILRDKLKATQDEGQAEQPDLVAQHERQYKVLVHRLEVACKRIVDQPNLIQAAEVEIERETIDRQFATCQDAALNRAAEGANLDNLAEDEDRLEALYRGALRILLAMQLPRDNGAAANNMVNGGAGVDALRIPHLQIAPFDGRFDKWESFRESFEHGIHNRINLAAVQKLQFLKGVLRGEAEELIANFGLSDENYQSAWDLLNRRYNNKRELVISHLRVIISLPKCSEHADDLRRLCNKTSSSLMALRNLGRPTAHWDDWVVFHVCSKLGTETRRLWEHSRPNGEELPTWDDLDNFLQGHIRALACGGGSAHAERNTNVNTRDPKIRAHQTSEVTINRDKPSQNVCPCCSEGHLISFCEKFRSMSVDERRRLAANKSLCFICLRTGHQAQYCRDVLRTCQVCKRKHNSMLHTNEVFSEENRHQVQAHTCSSDGRSGHARVLLATAIVNVRDASGESRQLRALLDQGAEASFISEHAAQSLQLPRIKHRAEMEGIGGVSAGRCTQSVMLCVSDRFGSGFAVNVSAHIIPRINNRGDHASIARNQPTQQWPHTSELEMADPECLESNIIDILLGGDVYGRLLLSGVRQYPSLPTAQNTHLGWILSGRLNQQYDISTSSYHIVTHHITIENQLAKFWEMEEPSSTRRFTIEEELCETLYENHVRRDVDGRIHVRLPMKSKTIDFGESQRFAVQRQLQIERKFETNPEFADKYRQFMAQYCELGHMEEVVGATVDLSRRAHVSSSCREYYIPHHAVMKEDSSTTKLRVVFDASRRTTTGVSLNDQMFTGPRLQDDLLAIIMRWRQFKVAFTADIEKMYRQFVVDAPDCDLQRIVWRPAATEPMKVYRLTTVTYGTASAPYLAIKSLQKLANLESTRHPIGAHMVLNHFYVDDVLGGANSTEECIEVQQQLLALLQSGNLPLRKWASNDNNILERVRPEDRESKLPLNIHDGEGVSTLGMQWNPASDDIGFKINHLDDIHETHTKRTFLSASSRLYDPLGWVAPCTIVVKMMFQKLWKMNVKWDDQLPEDFVKRWESIRSSLHELQHMRLRRWINTTSECEVEIHGFCDASMDAYAAVVYAKVSSVHQQPVIHLLCAKTRVAPIKVLSLPRLELCGAVLLTDLIRTVTQAMQWPDVKVCCWTDSTIVLSWLRGDPSTFGVFVANRTSEIQRQISAENWRHVRTGDNPADCASRGITVAQLRNHHLWWTGPEWVRHPSSSWPEQPPIIETHEEQKIKVNIVSETKEVWDLIGDHSSWRRLTRLTALCMRFGKNCRTTRDKRATGLLEPAELIHAREFWVRSAQEFAYQDEIRHLRNNKLISKSSSLLSLNPFLSTENILCVGGRLANATGMTSSARMPAIVPRRSRLSALLIRDAHEQTLHGGPALMLAVLRRAYWIINASNEVRKFVKRCTVCFRESAKPQHQLMAALPAARVVPSRPFLHCAMDYSGAILVRTSKGRGHHANKAYIAVFVCLTTKAIHIELVGDLSTGGFIAAYERFTSRRGCCSDLYSDNATNFVGASSTLLRCERKVFGDKVRTSLANKGTTWHFSPPLSPHFNGLAESAIRSVKHHIRRVVGESTLTFEELTTVLTKIEACLNSRPLYPMSSNPEDFDVLTPGHFLIGEPTATIPQRDVLDVKMTALNRWQLTHQMVQRFWKRWSTDYLHTLQQRRKWKTTCDNIKIGELVLMLEDNLPPAKWALGRVLEVHPGDDGKVRVITIKARGSTFKRSIVKVARLPVEENATEAVVN